MRHDATIDGRAIVCANSSTLGYSRVTARVGCCFVYREYHDEARTHYQLRLARMLGRVKYAPALTGDTGPAKNLILALALSDDGRFGYERWVRPEDVSEIYDTPPTAFAAFFFAPKIPHDVHMMRRLMEYGTMSDSYIANHEETAVRLRKDDAEWEARKGQVAEVTS